MGFDAAPQGAFGGDRNRIGGDLERRDAEPIEMRGPGCMIGEETVRVLGQTSDLRTGEGALAHVGQRIGIDEVITVARAQQLEEVAAALGTGGAEPGKMSVADLCAAAVDSLVAGPGVI